MRPEYRERESRWIGFLEDRRSFAGGKERVISVDNRADGENRVSSMTERKEAIACAAAFENVYEDYPFHDPNWCVMRHKKNQKTFALIYEKDGHIWINVKCDPEWRDFWRETFASVVPGYHMNKEHWNSIILDGTVPDEEIRRMIAESYDLTKPRAEKKKERKRNGKESMQGE